MSDSFIVEAVKAIWRRTDEACLAFGIAFLTALLSIPLGAPLWVPVPLLVLVYLNAYMVICNTRP